MGEIALDTIEESEPAGKPGLVSLRVNTFFPYKKDYPAALDDCLVVRPKPFRIVIWEPLLTDAPGPPDAEAYCCYIKTVIFYKAPHRVDANGGGYERWDEIETRLSWDDLVQFEGDVFEIGGGSVKWANDRWWMCRYARRVPEGFVIPAAHDAKGNSDE